MEELFDVYSVETGWQRVGWDEIAAKLDAGFVKAISDDVALIPDLDALSKVYFSRVQQALDAFAKSRGYDSIISAVSYAGSGDMQYAIEGAYCMGLRDSTWKAANKLAADMISGTVEPIAYADFFAALPVASAEWPDADEEDDE